MLLIGSAALKWHGIDIGREPGDEDYICTFEQFQEWTRKKKDVIKSCQPLSDTKFHVLTNEGLNIEFEIAWEGTAARQLLDLHFGSGIPSLDWLYALKMSHRYLKNSVHFLKTMRDIQLLREHISPDAQLIIQSDWFKLREEQTYTYKHPKLDVSKQDFFTDDVPYEYDHDDLHRVLALDRAPAYTNYMKDGSEVMTSKEKFYSVSDRVRLLGGLEESLVLCAERSLIPNNFEPDADVMFRFALGKLCTSISSGWFREFCWEYHDEIIQTYENECKGIWVDKLKEVVFAGGLKKF